MRRSMRRPALAITTTNSPAVKKKTGDDKSRYADPGNIKIRKRLEYLLRFGAIKERLHVSSRGFVKLADIMTVPLFSTYAKQTLINEIDTAISERGNKMYEMKTEDGEIYVKSLFSRKFERSPYHDDSNVTRLLEMCMRTVCTNITDYSLDGFPDQYIIEEIVHRLKRAKHLNNKSLPSIIGPHLQQLDLADTYLTTGSLRMVMTCANLRKLNLKFCGYLLNDELLKRLMKNLPLLSNLDVTSCTHLTSTSLSNVSKFLPAIRVLNVARIPNFKEADILQLLDGCRELINLDIHGCKLPLSDSFCVALAVISQSRPELVVVDR